MKVNDQNPGNEEPSLEQLRSHLIRNFRENFEHCCSHVAHVHSKSIDDIALTEVRAACEYRQGHLNAAAQYYEVCIGHDPSNQAFYNNLACVLLDKKQFQKASDLLKSASSIWKIPVIWSNLSRVQQLGNIPSDHQVDPISQLSIALNKYPLYRNYEKDGLIHSFELPPHMSTSNALSLQDKIIQRLTSLNFLSPEERNRLIQDSQQILKDIATRKDQQESHGIAINKRDYSLISLVEALIQELSQSQGSDQLGKLSQIQIDQFFNPIKGLIQNIITTYVDMANKFQQNEKIQNIQDKCIQPFRTRLQQLFKEYREKIQSQIRDREKHLKNLEVQKTYEDITRDEIKSIDLFYNFRKPVPEYKLFARESDYDNLSQRAKVDWQFTTEKGSQNSMLKIMKFTQDGNEGYAAYVQMAKFKELLELTEEFQVSLTLNSEGQRIYLKKFNWVLALLFKFYDLFVDNNYDFKRLGKQEKLELNQLVEIVYPLLEHMPFMEQNFPNVGFIVRQVHYGLFQYITVCSKPQQVKKKTLKLLSKISQQNQMNPKCHRQLVLQIARQKHHIQLLTNDSLLKIDSSTTAHEHFRWRISRQHLIRRQSFDLRSLSEIQELLIENTVTLLACLTTKGSTESEESLLIEAFVDWCYEFANNEPERKTIIKNFYNHTHEISMGDKVKDGLRNIIRKVLF